jgi:hypothetical protein
MRQGSNWTRRGARPTAMHLDTGRLTAVSQSGLRPERGSEGEVTRMSMRRRLVPALGAILLTGAAALMSARAALAENLCVGNRPGCFSTLQAAVSAAHDGDRIAIAPGTYAGGVAIDVSVNIVGAGAGSTVIRGGGSVLTIGVYGASVEPTVSIAGVTITGGVARSSPESTPSVGEDGVIARGGGVEIPPNANHTGGATVTISRSVITGNRVAPTHALPIGPPCPGGVKCPFAQAAGGGIDNWGTLSLKNSTVSHNTVGSASGLSTVASDADGGAIANELGALRISNSTISRNAASATAPNGRFADSGAVLLENGTLTMRNSTVTANRATLAAAEPNSVAANNNVLAIAGGIHIGGNVTAAKISNTAITGNSASMTNTVGNATAFSGGLHTDRALTLSNSVIADNSVYSATLPGSPGDAQGDSAAGELTGTISNTRLTGNTVTVRSAAGTATASSGATIFAGTLTDSIVSNNHVFASSPNGAVFLGGGGLESAGPLTLRNTTVRGNAGHANGRTGSARGGGIFAVDESAIGGPPGGPLVLTKTNITHNRLSGSAGITLQGGGIFATDPVTLNDSRIAHNHPDQCDGC